MLSNRSSLNELITDLEELLIFYHERQEQQELNSILSMYHSTLREVNSKMNVQEAKLIAKELEDLLLNLKNKELHGLLAILENDLQMKTLLDNFGKFNSDISKLEGEIDSLKNKIKEQLAVETDLEKKHKELRKEVLGIRRALEKTVTKELKRRVAIIGDELLLD